MKGILIAYFLYHFGIASPVHIEESRVQNAIPSGAQRVPVLAVHVEATCARDIRLETLKVQHGGQGSVEDIASLYLISKNRRLHRGRQLQRDGSVELRMRNVLVPACGSLDMTLMADFSPNAASGGEHYFTVENRPDVRISTADTSIRTGAGPTVGSIAVSYPKLLRSVHYGSRQAVARISLHADGITDQRITAITLTNQGSARETDLQNLYLEASRKSRVTNIAPSLDGDRIRLVFDPPLLLEKNQQRLFALRADVRASRSRTLQFTVEQPSDIEASAVRGR